MCRAYSILLLVLPSAVLLIAVRVSSSHRSFSLDPIQECLQRVPIAEATQEAVLKKAVEILHIPLFRTSDVLVCTSVEMAYFKGFDEVHFHFWTKSFHFVPLMDKSGFANSSRKGVMHIHPGPGGV